MPTRTETAVPGSAVRVVPVAGGHALLIDVAVAAGQTAIELNGEIVAIPTRHTVQIGKQSHVLPCEEQDLSVCVATTPWMFMNHSCEPTVMLRGRAMVALRDLEAGDAIAFDYETTEYSMFEPFLCGCGSARCRGWIRGFRYLEAYQRARLAPLLAPHLRALVNESPAEPAAG